MNNVTIIDVAEDAGVSTATVSHVINKTRHVSDELVEKVNASIKKLNYYPNRLVGSLRGKATFTIGMVIPSIANETFGNLAELIQTSLFELGYNLIVCNTSYDTDLEKRALNTFLSKKVDAIIAIPTGERSAKLEEIHKMGIPIILVDRVLPGLETDAVLVDNHTGQFEIISYLIRMGHQHIGYVDRMLEQSHSASQRDGYLAALKNAGITPRPDYIVNARGPHYKDGMDAAQVLMRRCPEITAIACYYDPIAIGVLRGLYNLGYRVPQDVSVVGYDNMLFTEVACPALTTVETHVRKIARETCKVLLLRLEEKEENKEIREERKKIEISPKLIIRESVAKLDGNP